MNGQCWVERSEQHHILIFASLLMARIAWRREDLQSYMFRLYLEYARLVSPDRDNGGMVRVTRLLAEEVELINVRTLSCPHDNI